jgi:Trk K+ transport system NAD-binding subunit
LKIVIAGAGEVGFHIASHLAVENKEVVVIEKSADAIQRVSDNLDVQVLQGSGSSPVVLDEAGIHKAEVTLAVADSDETNPVACLVANMLSPSTKKMARVRDGDFDQYHDPAEILSNRGISTDNETGIIKTHSQIGYDILKEIEFSWPIAQTVYQHRERLDGSGYPRGLSGDDILMEARILAVADVVEAMSFFSALQGTAGNRRRSHGNIAE